MENLRLEHWKSDVLLSNFNHVAFYKGERIAVSPDVI